MKTNDGEKQDFSGLNPGQRERLHLLQEECAEVIQACSKALRHGLDSYSPFDEQKKTNRIAIQSEMADVAAIMLLLLDHGDLPHPPSDAQIYLKMDKLRKYTHHQEWDGQPWF